MSIFHKLWNIGAKLAPLAPDNGAPDWVQANARAIQRASDRAQAREGGGWVVLDATRRIGDEPRRFDVAGQEWVAWRGPGGVQVAPNECPHMGARLSDGHCEKGRVVCPWHGLSLSERHGVWRPRPVFDDGVLLWARLLDDEAPTDMPVLVKRVPHVLEGTLRMEAKCEPEDIVANRLDPWHGTHYHPYSFATLRVTDRTDDVLTLRVAYRAFGPLVVEVDCTFEAPTRRCIVMTITGGDGKGSVVETHATPIGKGRCAVIETTLAASDRPGARHAKKLSRLIRPMIERRAGRLWVEDIAYAERRYELRTRSQQQRSLRVVDK